MSTVEHQRARVAQSCGVWWTSSFSPRPAADQPGITIDDRRGHSPDVRGPGPLGDNTVRTVAMNLTQGLVRGMEAIDTGRRHPPVPVGPASLAAFLTCSVIHRRQGTHQRQGETADPSPIAAVRGTSAGDKTV